MNADFMKALEGIAEWSDDCWNIKVVPKSRLDALLSGDGAYRVVPSSALERIFGLCDEVVAQHRDKESSDYNECDLPDEQCKWCADYLESKAMIATEQGE